MIQGTTSDAGKSICVAGLCRVLKRRGINVAPFKPQNMALNSAVTIDGGEIGRAQALQADACGLEYRTDFNPVLLKPDSDQSSQVIVQGKAVSKLESQTFGDIKALAFDRVLESYHRLRKEFDVVIVEGAGSPAEVNLRANDIANMGFAEAVDCPVVLISDINPGGVFAHIVGTLNCLSQSEQNRIKGFIINKFRGSIDLLQDGLDWLESKTNKPVFGVIPWLNQLKLDAEDAIETEQEIEKSVINVVVPLLPRISNHTDFEPLRWHPQVNFRFIAPGESLSGADLIILPGSKNVRADLQFLIEQGWDSEIKKHCRYGGKLLGICGGFQMLGERISDPDGIEGDAGESVALRLLDITTRLHEKKQLTQISGVSFLDDKNAAISGYEIHCGVSQGEALSHPFAQIQSGNGEIILDGAISDDNLIAGTYIHGLFESAHIQQTIVQWAKPSKASAKLARFDWKLIRELEIERLADHFEQHLDIDQIVSFIS